MRARITVVGNQLFNGPKLNRSGHRWGDNQIQSSHVFFLRRWPTKSGCHQPCSLTCINLRADNRQLTINGMKSEVLNGLLTAKTLFDAARRLCMVRDRHMASAGLILLQDAVELVLYACLIERGIDETKSIESFTFDQLIGELRSMG